MKRLKGLPKILSKNTRVLILGSFPGPLSLKHKQYYANPRNHFWWLMKAVLGWRELPENYQEKRRLLLKAGIGLWDIIKSCERKGADDNRIRNEKINDLPGLIQRYPRIKTVFCNGRKSYDLCKELCGHNIHIKYLPSSSPAHAIRLSAKTKKWMIIKKCLKNT